MNRLKTKQPKKRPCPQFFLVLKLVRAVREERRLRICLGKPQTSLVA